MVPMALFVDRFFDEAGQLNTPYRKWIVEGSSAVTIVLILVILAVKP